uniref:CCHC-type domain-containing protein n=1 Tax=Cyprinodon variegatus TaxID=28743 RepID=A0A3Q2DJ08_CYPVA
MTVHFKEQMDELAAAYNVSPVTLSQVAATQIYGKTDHPKGALASTPAAALRAQPSHNPRVVVSADSNQPCGSKQTPNDSLLINPLPADVQKVIVEHIVKHDSPVHLPTTRELRLFSGNFPKPPSEVDFGVWRLRIKQVLNDSSVPEVQQRRTLLDSLLAPALTVALSIGPQASPSAYLQELDMAYGNVTGGEELYIQFLETHQNSGERASDYLRRLQTLLQEVVESNGVAKRDADSQLLKQFLRGCWDDMLLTTLHLKEPLTGTPKRNIPFSELLFRIRTYEKESQLKEMEQLEERVRQLEAELQKNTPAQNDSSLRHERTGRRFPQRAKSSTLAPPVSAVPAENLIRTGKFCYNCGEDSHMLPQCTNPTNAVLVQKKLCTKALNIGCGNSHNLWEQIGLLRAKQHLST